MAALQPAFEFDAQEIDTSLAQARGCSGDAQPHGSR
jgi:hypothetical protein